MNFPLASRREALAGAVSIAATSIIIANKSASAASGVGGINAIPEIAPQWKDLDLAEILTRPAAYMSVSQNKSLYDPGGVQAGEKHRERGSLPATVKVETAARKAPNSNRSTGSATRCSGKTIRRAILIGSSMRAG
jgi:hypothetical protein